MAVLNYFIVTIKLQVELRLKFVQVKFSYIPQYLICNIILYRDEGELLIPLGDIARAGVYIENTSVGINYFVLPPNKIDKE